MLRSLLPPLLCFFSIITYAQEIPAFDLFEGDEVLEARLITDFQLLDKNTKEEEYQDAIFQWIKSEGDTMHIPVEVRARGNMRKEYCEVPPLRIKFPKDEYEHHKLKWVHNCRWAESYQNYIVAEYLAYRIYRIFTDTSFRVRLFHVEFVDTGGKLEPYKGYAFIIEDDDQLADRIGMRPHAHHLVKESKIADPNLNLINFFQYMIGNTDWSVVNKHNLEVFETMDEQRYVVVPFDFDYSGLVFTPYAIPQDGIPIKDVRIRYNKGYCMEEGEAEALRLRFLAARPLIMEEAESLDMLSASYKKSLIKFLDRFFMEMEKEKKVRFIFSQECLKDFVNH